MTFWSTHLAGCPSSGLSGDLSDVTDCPGPLRSRVVARCVGRSVGLLVWSFGQVRSGRYRYRVWSGPVCVRSGQVQVQVGYRVPGQGNTGSQRSRRHRSHKGSRSTRETRAQRDHRDTRVTSDHRRSRRAQEAPTSAYGDTSGSSMICTKGDTPGRDYEVLHHSVELEGVT